MSPITTHVLDTSVGRPAAGVEALLAIRDDGGHWSSLGSGVTDDDGRIKDLLPADHQLVPGSYKLEFAVGAYWQRLKRDSFYDQIPIIFQLAETGAHYHVPLLLNPYGYTTYRGS